MFDGSNFYHGVKKCWQFFHISNLNYFNLSKLITHHPNPKVIYYVGEIKKNVQDIKSQALYAQQQAVFYNLQQMGVEVKKGFILQNGKVYAEKGVDVQIAVDLAVGAVKDRFDVAYLISSDSDLVPAVNVATKESKKVIYVAFDKFQSNALIACSTKTFRIKLSLLRKAGTVQFMLPTKP